ncbi:MAG: SGNH/GDSL hydrolase family protein [Muribaculaceae bacterium]|nr:SGNH/GDSL hydrolase family protein [Muribaculaceae bacterium]
MLALAFSTCIMAAAKTGTIRYTAATDLNIINRAQPAGADSSALARLDVDRYPQITPTVNRYGRYSTGLAVAFRTDSPVIQARWNTSSNANGKNTTPILQSGLDLYIMRDGKWTFAGVGVPKNGNKHSATIVADMDGSMHECILYMPMFNSLSSLEIGTEEGYTIEPIANPFRHHIVVIGSSITHGASASRPGLAYPARMERATGLEFCNLGFSGQCKLDSFFAQIAADTKADAFIFDTFSNPSAEQIDERLKAFVDTIRASHPSTPLIFLQTEVRETGNFDLKKRKFESDKRAAAEAGLKSLMDAGYNDIYFINPGMPIGDDHECTVDGTHPTDTGFANICAAILPQITEILARYGIK